MWPSIPLRLFIFALFICSIFSYKLLSDADVGAPIIEQTVSQDSYKPEHRRLIFTVAVALSILAFVIFLKYSLVFLYQVGKIRLSPQSVAHRRNVMLATSMMLLTEIFKIDMKEIVKHIGIPPEASSFATGVLCFFVFYSLIEYCFSFASD